nr:hypothetical protein [Desulforamulus aquiferis]
MRNSNFDSWVNITSPRNWVATNVERTTQSFNPPYAVLMGRNATQSSTLSQEFPVTPNSNNRVSFRLAENLADAIAGNFSFASRSSSATGPETSLGYRLKDPTHLRSSKMSNMNSLPSPPAESLPQRLPENWSLPLPQDPPTPAESAWTAPNSAA